MSSRCIDKTKTKKGKMEDIFLKIARSSVSDAVRQANEGVDDSIDEARKHSGPALIGFQNISHSQMQSKSKK